VAFRFRPVFLKWVLDSTIVNQFYKNILRIIKVVLRWFSCLSVSVSFSFDKLAANVFALGVVADF
jgi:hypothetical protein